MAATRRAVTGVVQCLRRSQPDDRKRSGILTRRTNEGGKKDSPGIFQYTHKRKKSRPSFPAGKLFLIAFFGSVNPFDRAAHRWDLLGGALCRFPATCFHRLNRSRPGVRRRRVLAAGIEPVRGTAVRRRRCSRKVRRAHGAIRLGPPCVSSADREGTRLCSATVRMLSNESSG